VQYKIVGKHFEVLQVVGKVIIRCANGVEVGQ